MTIHQYDNTSIRQYTNTTIHQHNNTPTQQYTNTTIHQHNNTTTQQYTNTSNGAIWQTFTNHNVMNPYADPRELQGARMLKSKKKTC
jgi:hypothetical protein